MNLPHADSSPLPPFSRRGFLGGLAASTLLAGTLPTWGQEQSRKAPLQLHYHTEVPANAEPDLTDLVKDWITPTSLFYIRSHAPVPQIDLESYRLTIEGLVENPLSLSLAQLRAMADTEVIATLTCAGNRRSEHNRVKQVSGVPWNSAAIGNASWHGVKLSTLLKRAGVKSAARHVWFEGLDQIAKGDRTIGFGGSIPIQKALLDTEHMPGALVATGMNGEALPPDHGFPARTVVPGYIGARSVKWLGKIVVSDHTSPNHYLQDAYKIIVSDDQLELAQAAPIYNYPVNSVIASPKADAQLSTGTFMAKGLALAQGEPGSMIERVEVSTNGGRNWRAAKLIGPAKAYCWRLWEIELPIEETTRQLVARATDSHGHRQPVSVDWNRKGYMYNAWYRVPVTVAQ